MTERKLPDPPSLSPELQRAVTAPRPTGRGASGQRQRMSLLIEEHSDFVARTLRAYGMDAIDVDDGLQEVFLVLARRLDDVIEGCERSFLFRTAHRVAAHSHRKRAARRESLSSAPPERPSLEPSPEVILDQQQAFRLMQDVLAQLPPELAEVFVLFELEELSSLQIAEMLGLARGTVASRLRRARELVQRRLTRLGWLKRGEAP